MVAATSDMPVLGIKEIKIKQAVNKHYTYCI
jgi:hypothetical protein